MKLSNWRTTASTVWAAAFYRQPEYGHESQPRVQTGRVWVNTLTRFPQAPFGGYKQSGIGRELTRSCWNITARRKYHDQSERGNQGLYDEIRQENKKTRRRLFSPVEAGNDVLAVVFISSEES